MRRTAERAALVLITGIFIAGSPLGLASSGGNVFGSIASAQEASAPIMVSTTDGTINPLDEGSVIIEADEVLYDFEERVVTADGNVQIYYGPRILLADSIRYEETEGTVSATGNVSITDETGAVAFGDYVELDGTWSQGIIEGFGLLFDEDNRIAATRAKRTSPTSYELENAVFSACPVCDEASDTDPLWQFKARRVIYDQDRQSVVYRGAVMEVKGVPVFYTPYFSHADPLTKRKTGFLMPSAGDFDDLGSFVSLPFYYTHAPNLDFTVTPTFFTEENPFLEAEVRWLQPWGETTLEGGITPPRDGDEESDQSTEGDLRHYLFFDTAVRLDELWNAGLNLGTTSDDTFMRRYRVNSLSEIVNRGFVQRIQDWNFANVRAFYYEGLRDEDDQGLIPVTLPDAKIEFFPSEPVFGGQAKLGGSLLSLTRSEGTDVLRLSANAGWTRETVTRFGHKFSVFGDLRGDFYQTNDFQEGPLVPSGDEDVETTARILPLAGAQWSYPVIRTGKRFSQIIEPIAQLVFATEGSNPDEIPNEDSLSFEFDDGNLFNRNKFPGLDLWEPGTRVNLGVKATLIGFGAGENSILVGQTFRSNAQDVFQEGSGLDGTTSDIVGRIVLSPTRNVSINHRFRLDSDASDFERNELGVRLGGANTFLTVDYLKVRESLAESDLGDREEIYTTAGVALTDRWLIAGGYRRDLDAEEDVRTDAQIRYLHPCAEFSVNFTRRFTQDRDVRPDSSIFFRVKLRTLTTS